MTVSVTLAPQDVAFVEAYVSRGNAPSRSAALREALRLLRASHEPGAVRAGNDDGPRDASSSSRGPTLL
ncbi:Arc/MetJ-type ribon-helix-helix transcriptional regulator [Streptosporangium saharense]|uniref:Arc/MetJ-type ribon-helix-helix transcriptional regulator n=1 Tax=Streptosporangium saharense TaxID=1706840 RepID=A0A7W7QJB6_9ACTN|nr:Arc/MetJ-type ribon-helix-helix transcriptional regulator [Streptosporangium saharense]